MKRIMIYPLLFALLLSGCHINLFPEETAHHLRLVTQVRVTYEDGPIQASRLYTDAEKMRRILNYLRLIEPEGTPQEDPQRAQGSLILIVLQHSDGTEKTYRQKANRFLKEDDGQWVQVNPEKAQELCRILCEMDSDIVYAQQAFPRHFSQGYSLI